MCGICGILNYRHPVPVDENRVYMMMDALQHRGPDDAGAHFSGNIGLGFRRLSIIDLADGHQPMSDGSGNVWIVFNGEIYNYIELRKELESGGSVFRTRSDTEVILQGYLKWGVDVLDRLNGMFGLGIWDARNERFMLARDRLGIKPLYYSLSSDQLMFASEIRSILAGRPDRAGIDSTAVNLFLRYRYTPSPLTIFRGIRKLAPGSRLIVENGKIRIEQWWKYAPEPFLRPPKIADAEEELLSLYRSAVKRQLRSDVPVGLLLSGGLDSGLLLALMNEHGSRWKTFTVGYGENYRDDELAEAAETASILGSPNYSVELDRRTFEAVLSRIIEVVEEPVASSSVVPMYFVSQEARERVKVALIGQGPDELFGGYRRHLGVRYGAAWRLLPGFVRAPVAAALSLLPRNETIRRSLYSLGQSDRIRRYQNVFSLKEAREIDALFIEGALAENSGDTILECWSDLLPRLEKTGELGGFQFLELRSTLPDELLMYGDKLSMIHGLEVRVPYLDHTIVEYVERLPDAYKVRWGTGKWLHRRICERYLPERILERKKKGFGVNVVDEWFRNSITGKLNETLLDPESHLYGFMRYDQVLRLITEHRNGVRDNHKIIYSLIVLEEWLRTFRTARVPSREWTRNITLRHSRVS